MKARFNVKWKAFNEGEVVNSDEFAEKMLDYLCERGVAKRLGGAPKKARETAEKKPKAERAVRQAAKPAPGKPESPKDAEKKADGTKE